jgi:hypothetical protein
MENRNITGKQGGAGAVKFFLYFLFIPFLRDPASSADATTMNHYTGRRQLSPYSDWLGAGSFPLRHQVLTGFGAHPTSYPMGTGGSFPWGKAAGKADHPPPSSAEVKECIELNLKFLQYVSMAQCFVKHRTTLPFLPFNATYYLEFTRRTEDDHRVEEGTSEYKSTARRTLSFLNISSKCQCFANRKTVLPTHTVLLYGGSNASKHHAMEA